ncbi:MAG: hypothetical protein HKM28_00900 [Flavobacteriaceae bacterium]|nr:hypothetical protein [Flavobacteriaceae bacterium]
MNSEKYTYLLAHPQKIDKQDLGELATIIDSYPFFQSARALQLKGLKTANSFLYNDALKVTAAHTTDRDILFDYITSESFVQNEISQQILQHDASVHEIEVIAEDVSEETSVALDNRIKAELKKAEAILNPDLFERKVASVEKLIDEDESEASQEETSKEKEETSTLEVDAPLSFTKKDTHSFSEWLKLTKAKPIERSDNSTGIDSKEEKESETNTDIEEKERKLELIEKFIQERPKLIATDKKSIPEDPKDLAAPYTQTPNALMTETLAKVYLQQKNYSKAIQAYKILILKYPEKSGFFADQIRAIEKTIQTKEQ